MAKNNMKYYIIAGEPSGDLHGSNLMKGIVAEDSEAHPLYLTLSIKEIKMTLYLETFACKQENLCL